MKERRENGAPEQGSSWATIAESTVPAKTLDGIHSLVVRILLDIASSSRNGMGHRYHALGMTEEQIEHAALLSSDVLDDIASNYARTIAVRSLSEGAISCNYFEVGEMIMRRVKDEALALSFLQAQASNDLMTKLFGKRSTECRTLRSVHNIPSKKGRKRGPEDIDVAQMQIHKLYKSAMKEARCSRSALLIIYRKTGYPINFIHRIVTENDQLPL